VWVYELDESGTGSRFPPSAVTVLFDHPVGSINNNTGDCKTFNLPTPPLLSDSAYLFMRVQAVDTQSVATTSGALAQLGRVTATYTP
jgi:hypothetical protein